MRLIHLPQNANAASISRNRQVDALLVEDCPDSERTLLCLLTGVGAQVTLECNGESALDRVARERRFGREYDIILLNVAMPLLDGCEIARRLRDVGCAAPIVVVDTRHSDAAALQGLDANCELVSTPLEPVQLQQVLVKYLVPAGSND